VSTIDELARSRYVSLTTYRRDGVGVDTPVWSAVDAAEMVVWTNAGSWKVKRIRNDARVRVTVCSVRGRIRKGAAQAEGTARILEDQEEMGRVRLLLARKYGWRFRLTEWPARVFSRGGRARVGIAITF
jgi:uncharacterized protein